VTYSGHQNGWKRLITSTKVFEPTLKVNAASKQGASLPSMQIRNFRTIGTLTFYEFWSSVTGGINKNV